MGLADWFLTESYKVKCSDGRQLEVYRNVDKVFPLSVKTGESRGKAHVNVADQVNADVDVGTRSAISLAFISLDDLNNSSMLEMRAAYIAFKNDPCSNSDFYNREIVAIRENLGALKALRMKLVSIINALNQGANADLIRPLLSEVLKQLKISDVADNAANQIADARAIAVEMGGQ